MESVHIDVKLPPTPSQSGKELVDPPKWLPLKFGHRDTMCMGPIHTIHTDTHLFNAPENDDGGLLDGFVAVLGTVLDQLHDRLVRRRPQVGRARVGTIRCQQQLVDDGPEDARQNARLRLVLIVAHVRLQVGHFSQGGERPAAVDSNTRLGLQAGEKRLKKRRKARLVKHDVRVEFTSTAERPRSRVSNDDRRVFHALDQNAHGLRHDRGQHDCLGAFQDATERHDSSVAIAPVGVGDVFSNKRQDQVDDVILAAHGHDVETDAGRLARIPLIFVVELLLLSEPEHEDRHDELQGSCKREREEKRREREDKA